MNILTIIGFFNVLCAGILAGEEFTIRYGVRKPLASLEQQPHILFRQALILRLRVLVPTVFGLTLLSGIVVTIINGSVRFDLGFAFRCVGVIALISFITLTLLGTVPINQAAGQWDPLAPPSNWRALIDRWEILDNWRCWLALAAFVLFLAATLVR